MRQLRLARPSDEDQSSQVCTGLASLSLRRGIWLGVRSRHPTSLVSSDEIPSGWH